MKVRMEFDDDATGMLLAFQKVNLGLVKEGLQRASSQLADEYKKVLKSEAPSEWGVTSFGGKRKLSVTERKQQFGQKFSKKTGEAMPHTKNKPANIADHVKFYTPPQLDALYAVVGGGHPTFYPIKYTNGIADGYLDRQSATTQETLKILDKLNDGETRILTTKERNLFRYSVGFAPHKVVYKARHFAEKARAGGVSRAIQKIKNLYETNFPKAVNSIKAEPYKTGTK
jgi:hypothetical protein